MSKKNKKSGTIQSNALLRSLLKTKNGKLDRARAVLVFGIPIGVLLFIESLKAGWYAHIYRGTAPILALAMEGLRKPFIIIKNESGQMGFGQRGDFGVEWSVVLVFMLIYAIVLTMSYISAEMMKNKSTNKDGDMEFGDPEEYNKNYAYPLNEPGAKEPLNPTAKEPGNMIISKNLRYSLSGTSGTYSCACVIGSTGSRKTFSYVKPNLMQMNASYIVTDPKTELIRDCGKMLERNGYNVLLFNLKKGEQRFSCRYNPFAYIRDEQDVILTVDAFLNATTDEKANGGDPFFPIAEKNFYYALFYYVFTQHRDRHDGSVGTLKEVYELYAKANETEQPFPRSKEQQAEQLENEFDKAFEEVGERDATNPCLSFYKTFKTGSPKTKQSILISVGIKLWFLSVPETANLLSGDDLHFDEIGERKSALFIAIPTDNDSFKCLSAMLFTQLFQELYYQGETLNAKTFLLKKGNTVAARSMQFIDGTELEEKAKAQLKMQKKVFETARLVNEEELAKTDEALKIRLETKNDLYISPHPMWVIMDKDGNTIKKFKGKEEAEQFLDAGRNGEICRVSGLAVRVRFLLDEFYAIGKIAGFEQKIATFRSLNISADIICQGLSQLKEMYDDHEGKITNNCDLRICLGVNDFEDAKAFSDMCGQTTVRTQNLNIDTSSALMMPGGGGLSDAAQMLVRPEYLMNKMQSDEMLVLTRTSLPMKDKKYDAPEHPNWSQTYNDHDVAKTEANKYDFRKIFCIEQSRDNLIQTVLPKQQKALTVERKKQQAVDDYNKRAEEIGRGLMHAEDGKNKHDRQNRDNNNRTNNNRPNNSRFGSDRPVASYKPNRSHGDAIRDHMSQSVNKERENYKANNKPLDPDQNGNVPLKDLNEHERNVIINYSNSGKFTTEEQPDGTLNINTGSLNTDENLDAVLASQTDF